MYFTNKSNLLRGGIKLDNEFLVRNTIKFRKGVADHPVLCQDLIGVTLDVILKQGESFKFFVLAHNDGGIRGYDMDKMTQKDISANDIDYIIRRK
jgi:hypothetical protein